MTQKLRPGYYWVMCGDGDPEIMLRQSDLWIDMGDDPGSFPDDVITVLKGPLQPPKPADMR